MKQKLERYNYLILWSS